MTTHMKFNKSCPIMNILNVKINTQPFFSQYLCISFACRACPPKMVCYWFYPWAKIITTCFFRNCVQLLVYVFAKVPLFSLFRTLTNANFFILFEFPAWVHWQFPYQWPYYLSDLEWSMSYIWRNVQVCHSVHVYLEIKLVSF